MKLGERSSKVALAIGSLCITFLLLEVSVRLLYGTPPPFIYPQVRHIPTAYGYKLEPNQEGNTYTTDKPVHTNSYGFRDYEWAMPKPTELFRLMCIGDSQTFGNTVRGEDTYPKVLDRLLKQRSNNVEVISAAVTGWNIDVEVNFFRTEGRMYKPDLLIYGFFPNDYISYHEDIDQVLLSYGENITNDGRWDSRPGWLRWLPYRYIFWAKRSALVRHLRDRVNVLLYSSDDTNMENRLILNQMDLENEPIVSDMYLYLKELKELCDDVGTTLLIASLPPINLFWVPEDSFDYNEHLKAFCDENGISFVDVSAGMRQVGDTNTLFLFPWDNHYSPSGHRSIAIQLEEAVRGMIPQGGGLGHRRLD